MPAKPIRFWSFLIFFSFSFHNVLFFYFYLKLTFIFISIFFRPLLFFFCSKTLAYVEDNRGKPYVHEKRRKEVRNKTAAHTIRYATICYDTANSVEQKRRNKKGKNK